MNGKPIGTIICRGFVALALTAGALALRADDTGKKESATAGAAKAGDAETCLQEAAKMNMTTIKFAELASQKAQNPELKRFAQTLQQDHQKAQKDLEALARTHNVSLSTTTLDDKCKEELSRLEALSGQEFDREFAKSAVEGHAAAIAHVEQGSTQAKDADVRQYTQKMLAQLKQHQLRGREIAKAVGVDQTTIASLENKAREGVGGPAARTESSSASEKKEKE
jgi:putative membrane protein